MNERLGDDAVFSKRIAPFVLRVCLNVALHWPTGFSD